MLILLSLNCLIPESFDQFCKSDLQTTHMMNKMSEDKNKKQTAMNCCIEPVN